MNKTPVTNTVLRTAVCPKDDVVLVRVVPTLKELEKEMSRAKVDVS